MMKAVKIAKGILFFLAAIFLLYGVCVLLIIGGGHWFNFAFIAAGVALLVIGICLEQILKCNKWVLRIICVILVLCLCNFAIFEIKAISFGTKRTVTSSFVPENNAKWVIVLGAKVQSDGGPKLEYAVRLVAAEKLCKENQYLILTGGKGVDEPVTEAEGGYNYLQSRGNISAKEIILEDQSTSTTENLVNSLEILKGRGGNADDSVVIVSSSFHLYRAKKIAEKAGYTNTEFAGANGIPLLVPYYYVREYAAYIREN